MIRFVFFLASGFAHFVLFRWGLRVFPDLRRYPRTLAATFVVLVVLPIALHPLLATANVRSPQGTSFASLGSSILAISMIETATTGICLLPLAVMGLFTFFFDLGEKRRTSERREGVAGDVSDTAEDDTPSRASSHPASDPIPRRRMLERIGGAAIIGGTGSMLGWGMIRGRHAFVIEEVPVRIKGLPRALDGYTIAQVSDIHAGVFVGKRELDEGLSRLSEIRSDLIVVTGDLVDFDARYAPLVAHSLAALKTKTQARDGIFAILGNHDYYSGREAVLAALTAAGITTLVNEGVLVRGAEGGGFALLGVDDLGARRRGGEGPSLSRALAMVPPDAPRILLAHQPPIFNYYATDVALQLSGHTHGGQIRPGGLSPLSLFDPYIAGRYQWEDSTMWINRGFGVTGPPSRIDAPPEITKIVLIAG